MLSFTPVEFTKVQSKEKDKEILRIGMIAELDAISFYEQLAATTSSPEIKKVLLSIAKEEKTHAGEFEAMLHRIDKEQVDENKKAIKEVQELTSG